MKINAKQVVRFRRSKSWSQEQLAEQTGLNLRTIQRIENEGVASMRSSKALAATFDVEVDSLSELDEQIRYEFKVVEIAFDARIALDFNKPLASELNAELNKHGQAGWKLAQVIAPDKIMGNYAVPDNKLLVIMQREVLS
ncbi:MULTISPECIES: helix-turn-helix domain-containing protein [Pseudoalteromonas]|uniref:HTH cro/C1-type domain-containing protein n=1 Tax=Pseudoalteromonas amylolytica TaxID=1859457 RepID=A0A1S1MTM9_9GAMM|nr:MULTISPECIES: helix-turn-helix domain-containing protein [Pseudoalteromonas]MCF6437597.1 DUF4177 domain-containing protein [Pseudoalteromonas sp. MMG022]OHU86680.1 hypothetical protein BFC16_14335 [Pseudoalteromonas sp. JW3]OHU88796.1 hypothetical protein BET10_18420 [Pseudoalteromonas amylolytica]